MISGEGIIHIPTDRSDLKTSELRSANQFLVAPDKRELHDGGACVITPQTQPHHREICLTPERTPLISKKGRGPAKAGS